MGKKNRSYTVGYKYYLGLHFGICHGPVDSVLEVEVGERTAWTGNYTTSGAIQISAPNLFGGEEREGGVQGQLDVMMGEPTQGANGYLQGVQGGPQPGYRGFLGFVWRRGLIAANNPYVKPWAFKIRRIVAGWVGDVWYPEKAQIDLGNGVIAANPAHIVYECLTNPEWGMGYPDAQIDDTVFRAAADEFYAEGFGLCIAWARQTTLESFIQAIMDHAGAVLSQNQASGLFQLLTLRDNYTPSALESFSDTAGNIVRVEKIDRSTITEAVNEVIVVYVDGVTGRQRSLAVQNLASVQSQEGVISQTSNYPGIPTAELAARAGLRDLKATTSTLARVRFIATRDAYTLAPGDVVNFSWAPSGILSMPLRVTQIDYGNLERGEIRVEALQDVFGLPDSAYAKPPPSDFVPPNYDAVASPFVIVRNANYKDLVDLEADTESSGGSTGFVWGAAAPPGSYEYGYKYETGPDIASVEDRSRQNFAPFGELTIAIDKTATSITLTNARDLDLINIGRMAILYNPSQGVIEEIIRVDDINLATQTLTIARGCVDLPPREWDAGTIFLCHDEYRASDLIEYGNLEEVFAQFRTIGANDVLETGIPFDNVKIPPGYSRHFLPYPAGRLRFNGLAYPETMTVGTDITVTWAHRDRILQNDQIIDESQGDIGPEPGVFYDILWTIFDANGSFITNGAELNVSDVNGDPTNTYTYDGPPLNAGESIRFVLKTMRDARAIEAERQQHTIEFVP